MTKVPVVSVLAGGWSAKHYDRDRLPGEVIGINEACLLARCDYGVSMDRLWVENRWLALWQRTDRVKRGPLRVLYARKAALKNIPERPTWLHPFDCDHESTDFSPRGSHRLNGTNSGACGLNLAANLASEEIYLFGFDMCRNKEGEAYWYPPYEWAKAEGATSGGKYKVWAAEFESIAAQLKARGLKVFNASLQSAITAFPKIDPRSVLK